MSTDRSRLFQLFKYAVYLLLVINVYVFFAEEWSAAAFRFGDNVALGAVIEGFASSIDTAAWVILLLLFELETYVLEDRQFTRRVAWAIHGLRVLCYTVIVYAFYGYLAKLLFLQGAAPLPETATLCGLVGENWAYAIDLDEYVSLTAANCGSLAADGSLLQLPALEVAVHATDYVDIVRLAWVDVINAGVWLLVVLVLEIDVRLQERKRLRGNILIASTASKFLLYGTLLAAAIYWGVKGDFIDFWDAFLWLVAFVFIELNVFEWRRDTAQGSNLA